MLPAPHARRPTPLRALAVALSAAVLVVASCREKPADPNLPPPPPRQYADSPDGLRQLWTDVIDAAQRDHRNRVHNILASMIMNEDDLTALFGPAKARYFMPRYKPMIYSTVNLGAMELVAQILEEKIDDVEVDRVDAQSRMPTDVYLLAALESKLPVYNVHVRNKKTRQGLRYDFFVFRRGRWLTGNQLALRYLVPPGENPQKPLPKATPAAPPADAGSAPPDLRAPPRKPPTLNR